MCVLDVLASPYNMCPFHYRRLVSLCYPSRNCCYAKCSHLVVKHNHGFFPLPSLSTSLQRRSSLGLWCSSCLVQVFSALGLQSPPPMHPEVYSTESSTYCLHGPTQCCFTWQGATASVSVSQPSVSVCVLWMGLAFAWLYPGCYTQNKRHPDLHTLDAWVTPSYA